VDGAGIAADGSPLRRPLGPLGTRRHPHGAAPRDHHLRPLRHPLPLH
jgi:hypothetical protein